MTLADLLTTLETRGALPVTRAKDCKTSLRYLAQALGHPDPAQCPVDAACQDPATWAAALETHFQALETQGRAIRASTRRNTRNNLRLVFRQAAAHGLLTQALPPVLFPRPKRPAFLETHRASAPYQTTYRSPVGPRYYGLPQAEWPPDIQAGWQAYVTECDVRLRATTLATTARCLGLYLGYLTHMAHRTPTWADLFSIPEIRGFVRWHGTRVGRPVSAFGHLVTCKLTAVAVVLQHPQARAMADFRNALQPPAPLQPKAPAHADARATRSGSGGLPHGRPPADPARQAHPPQWALPHQSVPEGGHPQTPDQDPPAPAECARAAAGRASLSGPGGPLAPPLERQRSQGRHAGRQPHTYHVDLTEYCPDFLPTLTEWLTVRRLRLPGAGASPYVFLTVAGHPFTAAALGVELKGEVAMRTGIRFYPHLIRTIWATEYLEATQNFAVAATMLGDTIGMVMKTYYDVVNKDQHAKAKAFLATALHTG